MGNFFTGDGWLIKVQGDEHPPVHTHVLHPNGKAAIGLSGTVQNAGVPAKVIVAATTWMLAPTALVEAEWAKMNNPRKR